MQHTPKYEAQSSNESMSQTCDIPHADSTRSRAEDIVDSVGSWKMREREGSVILTEPHNVREEIELGRSSSAWRKGKTIGM